MKVNKKFLASFMALTMAISPMTALAAATDPNDKYDGSTDTITGIGSITTIDTVIYNVLLPTSESINFNVDPYGLLALSGAGTEDSLKNVISNAAGTVTSNATAVINKSSVGIQVGIEVYLDENNVSNAAVQLASTREEAKDGDSDLFLEVLHLSGAALQPGVATYEAANVSGPLATTKPNKYEAYTISMPSLKLDTTVSTTTESATVVVATGAGSDVGNPINFKLGDVSDAYMVSKASVYLDESQVAYNSNNVYAFAIDGYAKPKAEVWNQIADSKGTLELTMKFTISKASNEVKTAYKVSVDSSRSVLIGITNTGGLTDYSKIKNVKRNGNPVTIYGSLVNGCFGILAPNWTTGDIITFEYDGALYEVTV